MEIIAKFNDSAISVVETQITTDNGETEVKHMTLTDFVNCLQESVEQTDTMLSIGKLPIGYYDGKIDPIIPSNFKCTIVIPRGIHPVNYFETIYLIPFPEIVFFFEVEKGNVATSRCFAVKDGPITDTTNLCHYPFGNVHKDGKVCWGSNLLPAVENLKDLDILVALFFGSPTNDDLYSISKLSANSPEYVLNLRSFYEELNGQDVFPEDVLKETSGALGELI